MNSFSNIQILKNAHGHQFILYPPRSVQICDNATQKSGASQEPNTNIDKLSVNKTM